MPLQIGDRVKHAPLFWQRHPTARTPADREGTVVSFSSQGGVVYVIWDGTATQRFKFEDELEKVNETTE